MSLYCVCPLLWIFINMAKWAENLFYPCFLLRMKTISQMKSTRRGPFVIHLKEENLLRSCHIFTFPHFPRFSRISIHFLILIHDFLIHILRFSCHLCQIAFDLPSQSIVYWKFVCPWKWNRKIHFQQRSFNPITHRKRVLIQRHAHNPRHKPIKFINLCLCV